MPGMLHNVVVQRGWNGRGGDDIIASRGVTKWPADRRPVAHDQSDSRVASLQPHPVVPSSLHYH